MKKPDEEAETEEKCKIAKTPTDLQRLRLDRLMKNIDKPAPIPNPKRQRKPPKPPEFVRNVVGSSAGAGSGEYHIYRNVRRKEFARLDFIAEEARQETLDKEYDDRVLGKQQELQDKTAKKRAKRLKKKQNKAKRKKVGTATAGAENEEANSSEGNSSDKEQYQEDNDIKISAETHPIVPELQTDNR